MNLKNVVNTYSVNFKVQCIQNYVFNTKNEMKLNMNMDSLRIFLVEYELEFNNPVKFMPYSIRYLPVPVNSADFTIPYLDNEYTNQTHSLLNLLF